MIIRKLEYLIALAKEEHFGRAAEACHVSQPTLSTALRQLEAEMGVMILKRGQRYSGLTDRGERVLVFAQRMAVECEHLRRDLENQRGDALGTLHVGVITSAIPIVSALTIPFQKNRPHVVVKISNFNPVEIQRGFEEFKLDIAITYLEEPVRRQGRSHPLYEEEYSLLAGKGSPLSRHKTISWQDVSELPLCLLAPEMLPSNSPLRDPLTHTGRSSPHIETNSITALYSHVRSGEWVAVLPRSLTGPSQAGSDFVAIPLPRSGAPASVGIMIPDRDLTFALAEEFFNVAVSAKLSPKRRASSS
jgi:DNA-binding transcriptional LysR family regulator